MRFGFSYIHYVQIPEFFMEIKWLNPDAKFDRLVLAGDIGGTNTNLGLQFEEKNIRQFTKYL